ncbi:ShET2/EspL2 family type III secretion system effector toxin [Pandoraea pulmonicola]|nr:ShET2/EspL2 family type III secretion system effector toxin [Pandoraea pulmonicola]
MPWRSNVASTGAAPPKGGVGIAKTGEKSYPYFSAKRDTSINWNGSATMRDPKSTPIECRHFALVWAENFESRGGRTEYKDFESPEAIRRNIPPLVEDRFETRLLGAHCYLAENDGWGEVLARNIREMVGSDQKRRSLLVLTTDHAMAVGIKFKHEGEQRYCVLQFYDPNKTVTHLRAKIPFETIDREGLGKIMALSAQDFLSPSKMEEYRLGHNGPALFAGEPAANPADRLRLKPEGVLSASALNILFRVNLANELRAAVTQILASGLSSDQCFEQLRAARHDGTSGLYSALQNGYVDAVREYVKVVLDSSLLSAEQKFKLMVGDEPDGELGLQWAFENGHAETIRTYAKLVLASGLSPEQKVELMAARRPDGWPGVVGAFDHGRADAIRAYAEEISASDLSVECQYALLAAKDPDGESAAIQAFFRGHADAVRAYVESVLASKLSEQQQFELLMAKDSTGVSGAHLALKEGRADVVSAFTEVISASHLPEQYRSRLLEGLAPQKRGTWLRALRNRLDQVQVGNWNFSTKPKR